MGRLPRTSVSEVDSPASDSPASDFLPVGQPAVYMSVD